jgi:competence protein ComEA
MTIRLFVSVLLAAFAINAAAAVDANTASRADLETVKGVGPGLSSKIVEARKATPFKDWADMVERVGGIGHGNAARFSQAGMTVAGAGYEAGAVQPSVAGKTKGAKADDKTEMKTSKKAEKAADKTADKAAEKNTDKAADKAALKSAKS